MANAVRCPIKVLRLDLDEQPEPIEIESRYAAVLVVPRVRGSVLGQVLVSASDCLTPQTLESAIERRLGDALWRSLARLAVARAVRGAPGKSAGSGPPTVSVVVQAREGAMGLARCLDSLGALRTPPAEILVCDRSEDEATERLCIESGATYLRQRSSVAGAGPGETILASQGELVAFVDGDCEVDPGWLDGLDHSFRDPLVMAVTGHVGPAELENAVQCRLEKRRGLERRLEAHVFGAASHGLDPGSTHPARAAWSVGSGTNAIVRRAFLVEADLDFGERVALPAPSLGELWTFYRILEGGYRVVFDPARAVWFRYPLTLGLARRAIRAAAAEASAFAIQCGLRHRELDAARVGARLVLGSGPHCAFETDIGPSAVGHRGGGRLRLAAVRGALAGVGRVRRRSGGPLRAPSMESLYSEPAKADTQSGSASPLVSIENYPDLAVLAVSFNRREKLLRLLQALGRQTYPTDRFQVTVVIDGSRDGSGEAARSLEVPYRLDVVEQDHRGEAAARNEGVRRSSAPVLLYVDDDMTPESRFLEEHARVQRDGDEKLVAIGYCPSAVAGETLWERMLRAWWEDHYRRMLEDDHQWTWIDFAVGNSSFRRSLFEALGGFDESFTRRNSDQEFGVQLAEAGARFQFCPGARAWHQFEANLTASLGDVRRQGHFDVLLIQKYPRLSRRVVLWGWFQADGSLRRRPALAYRLSRLGSPLLAPSVRLAALLERARMRPTWYALTGKAWATAYLLGLKDALSSGAKVGAVNANALNGMGNEVDALQARLGEEGILSISASGREPQLELTYRGEEVACLPAMRPGKDWAWDDLIERATAECVESLRRKVDLEELRRLAISQVDLDGRPRSHA